MRKTLLSLAFLLAATCGFVACTTYYVTVPETDADDAALTDSIHEWEEDDTIWGVDMTDD